ncbi:MAG: hypothetical protein JWL90_64 [Chthoniobacteraceae bacterium]|nr:hypothetical protein [Chthoniobacteraceae bacterium]
MPSEPSHTLRETVVYINLWPESGMMHYSESLVAAMAADVDLLYVRNHASRVAVEGWPVELKAVSLGASTTLWRLAREIIRRKPLAIHLNSELPVLLPLFPLFAFLNVVVTLHDAVPHEGERLVKRLFMRLHPLLLFFCVRKIIVHSKVICAELPFFLRSRVRVLPHVNYRLWAQDKSPAHREGPLSVLFFGRMLRYKGLEYLLEAFRQLDPTRFTLTIAGEGDLSGYELDAPNIRTIHRFITEEEMSALFNAAHVVALPYISASQSGVVYMAFAFDKPVIATCVGGIGDVVRDGINGLLVEPRSSHALAAALEQMSDETTRSRFIEQIRQEQVSTDEEIRSRLMAIYRES